MSAASSVAKSATTGSTTFRWALTAEEQRAVAEGLSEEELALFDILTKPEPVLTKAERKCAGSY